MTVTVTVANKRRHSTAQHSDSDSDSGEQTGAQHSTVTVTVTVTAAVANERCPTLRAQVLGNSEAAALLDAFDEGHALERRREVHLHRGLMRAQHREQGKYKWNMENINE